jgi:hypothetical protein
MRRTAMASGIYAVHSFGGRSTGEACAEAGDALVVILVSSMFRSGARGIPKAYLQFGKRGMLRHRRLVLTSRRGNRYNGGNVRIILI